MTYSCGVKLNSGMSVPWDPDPADAELQTRSMVAGDATRASCSRTGWKRIENVDALSDQYYNFFFCIMENEEWITDRQWTCTGLFVPFGSRKKITSLNRCLAWSDKVNTLVNKFSNIVYLYSWARPSPSTPITLDRNQYYYCWLVWRNFERVQTLQVSQLYISPLSSSTKT